jgi:hypothetical protein
MVDFATPPPPPIVISYACAEIRVCSVMCYITNEILLTFIEKTITGDLHEMKPSCKGGGRKIK